MDLYLTPWVKAASFRDKYCVEKDTGFPELWRLAVHRNTAYSRCLYASNSLKAFRVQRYPFRRLNADNFLTRGFQQPVHDRTAYSRVRAAFRENIRRPLAVELPQRGIQPARDRLRLCQ